VKVGSKESASKPWGLIRAVEHLDCPRDQSTTNARGESRTIVYRIWHDAEEEHATLSGWRDGL